MCTKVGRCPSVAQITLWLCLETAGWKENAASKQKTDITFAALLRPELSAVELAVTMMKFEVWERENLGSAETSEGRLTVWDHTHNGDRLAEIIQENDRVQSSRLRAMVSSG
jgi:hypothetical protein